MEKLYNSSLKRMGVIYLLQSPNADERLRNGSFWLDNRLILYSKLLDIVSKNYKQLNLSRWLHPDVDKDEFISWLKAQEIEFQMKEEYIRLSYTQSIDVKSGVCSYSVEPHVELPTVIYYNLPLSTILAVLQRTNHHLTFPSKYAILSYRDIDKEIETLIKQIGGNKV